MTVTAWRICKAKYAVAPFNPFDGEGARRTGGRWNSAGRRVVYTSQAASLAAMEMLVHLDDSALLLSYSLIPVTIPAKLIEELDPASLPQTWRESPGPVELQVLGDTWLTRAASAVLRVPSAVIESEYNYLLNPEHPNFPQLVIGDSRPFKFDPRLGA